MTALAISFLPGAAVAECADVYCQDVKVTYLYIDGNGSNLISTSGNEMLLSCSASGGYPLRLNPSAPKADWLFSTLLTAFNTGQRLTVRVTPDASGACEVAYIQAGTH